jgi:hypothetical protein
VGKLPMEGTCMEKRSVGRRVLRRWVLGGHCEGSWFRSSPREPMIRRYEH